LALGDGADDFLTGLKQRHRNCGFQARYILRLKEHYHCEDIQTALNHAMKYHAFDGKAIERILKARFRPRKLESMAARCASKIFSSLPQIKQRPLADYCHFIKEACHGRQPAG
jgi:hypothetical protein